MKGIALLACIAVVLVGMMVVSLLPVYPPSPEPEWRDPPTMCEQVRKYEPNQPLREHICRPPSVREQLEEQQRVRERDGHPIKYTLD